MMLTSALLHVVCLRHDSVCSGRSVVETCDYLSRVVADFILVHVATHVPRSTARAPVAQPRPPRASTRWVGGTRRLEMTGSRQTTDSGLCSRRYAARRCTTPAKPSV